MVYDGLGRATDQYVGYDTDETIYADASTVVGDTLMLHKSTTYDPGSYVTFVQTKQRFHNATGTGELTTPDGAQPKARVTYVAMWYNEVGRPVASADYGTNGGSAFTRPDSAPARSDTILVSTTEYNSSGEAYKTVDPAGREDRQEFDDAGRTVKTIQNYTDGDPSTGDRGQAVNSE